MSVLLQLKGLGLKGLGPGLGSIYVLVGFRLTALGSSRV